MTFPATVNPVLHLGLKPVFIDIEPGTLNIDLEKIEEKITRARAFFYPSISAGIRATSIA